MAAEDGFVAEHRCEQPAVLSGARAGDEPAASATASAMPVASSVLASTASSIM